MHEGEVSSFEPFEAGEDPMVVFDVAEHDRDLWRSLYRAQSVSRWSDLTG